MALIYSKVGTDDAITDAVEALTPAAIGAATAAALAAAVAALSDHAADTTAVHGIADTSALVLTNDARLSDARTPTAHTHDDRYFTEAEVTASLALKSDATHLHATVTTITEATTARTVGLTDAGKIIECTNASPTTITIPANATTAFPVGSVIGGARMGSGTLTIAGAGGVTINSAGGLLSVAEQYGAWAIRKTATDTWHLIGALG